MKIERKNVWLTSWKLLLRVKH